MRIINLLNLNLFFLVTVSFANIDTNLVVKIYKVDSATSDSTIKIYDYHINGNLASVKKFKEQGERQQNKIFNENGFIIEQNSFDLNEPNNGYDTLTYKWFSKDSGQVISKYFNNNQLKIIVNHFKYFGYIPNTEEFITAFDSAYQYDTTGNFLGKGRIKRDENKNIITMETYSYDKDKYDTLFMYENVYDNQNSLIRVKVYWEDTTEYEYEYDNDGRLKKEREFTDYGYIINKSTYFYFFEFKKYNLSLVERYLELPNNKKQFEFKYRQMYLVNGKRKTTENYLIIKY